jgi:hypothetical protein
MVRRLRFGAGSVVAERSDCMFSSIGLGEVFMTISIDVGEDKFEEFLALVLSTDEFSVLLTVSICTVGCEGVEVSVPVW